MSTRSGSIPLAIALAVAGLTVAPVSSAHAQITLRLHTHAPSAAASYENLAWWAQKVEKDSGGRLKIQLFGSNQLGGKAEDIYDQVRSGVVDIGWTLPAYKIGLFPATSAFELPFIGAEASIVSAALDAYVRKWGKAEWSAVRPVVLHSAGRTVFHMKTRPIEKLEDFRGLKVHAPSQISSAAITALGSAAVPVPGPKITEALTRDVVDGAVTSWSTALAVRAIDAAKYHTENTLYGRTLILAMNKQSYAKLPDDLKKVIDANSGAWLAREFGARWTSDDKRGRAMALALGHPVITLSKAEEARWRKASQPVYDNWIREMEAKGLPGRQMVEDAEALIAKHKVASQ